MSSVSLLAAATTSAQSAHTIPPKYRPVGVTLAIGSGLLIGSSFVFKKKGLLSSQAGHVAGEGVAYLKSPLWWTGMIIMILGEICNLAAYSFLEAIIVTPMGALSVVISAMLSHIVLKEKLSLFGWVACLDCILGATILALNGPEEQSVFTILDFKKLFLAPGFLAYGSVVIASALVLALFVAPRWGKRSMMPYIGICSLIGGLSVSCTQGLGACFVTTIRGDNQFNKSWFIYFLLAFVIVTLLTEIYYLNVALAMFNTAMVTPTYYVTFTACVLVTSVILYQGLKASATQIITVVLGFLVICTGIFILQLSKVDPRELSHLDRRTTLLLQAARIEIDPKGARELERLATGLPRRSSSARSPAWQQPTAVDGAAIEANIDGLPVSDTADLESDDDDLRAVIEKTEDPGIDSLRGASGALGSLIRARRRARALAEGRRSRTSSMHSGSGSRLSTIATVEKGREMENVNFRRDVLLRAATVNVVDSSGQLDVRPSPSVHFQNVMSGSAPPTMQRGEVEADPMVQAAAEEAARTRALTLPMMERPREGIAQGPKPSSDESKR